MLGRSASTLKRLLLMTCRVICRSLGLWSTPALPKPCQKVPLPCNCRAMGRGYDRSIVDGAG
ncbi:hypothetical protein C8R48DRAFT_717078 [Suillus tomentosus]|nr:hypothetical protein C8R48DRAFT_717078 [Suillus tomentosus]